MPQLDVLSTNKESPDNEIPHMKRQKLGLIDYSVMIGGPVVFILIAVVGIGSLLGTQEITNPISKLKSGEVKIGMDESEVLKRVGQPKSTTDNSSGGLTYRYEHGLWDTERKTFMEEDAYIDFDSTNHVSGISFESKTPPQPH